MGFSALSSHIREETKKQWGPCFYDLSLQLLLKPNERSWPSLFNFSLTNFSLLFFTSTKHRLNVYFNLNMWFWHRSGFFSSWFRLWVQCCVVCHLVWCDVGWFSVLLRLSFGLYGKISYSTNDLDVNAGDPLDVYPTLHGIPADRACFIWRSRRKRCVAYAQ